MRQFPLICLACVTFIVSAAGQQEANYQSADELQREVTFLLLDKNINDVTRQLDNENSSTVASLLRRLVIYTRAGQTSRVRKTLEQLPSTPNWQCPVHDFRWLIRNTDGDFAARRFYYERLCPEDVEGGTTF